MTIDPLTDEIFTLTAAAKRLPRLRKGRPVHPSTIWRWALTGIRGIRLETMMIGGVRVTSANALRQFIHALSERKLGPTGQSPAKKSSGAGDCDTALNTELDRLGIR